MAANARFHKLKRQVEKLRKDSLDLVGSANKILYQGVQKLADKELKALNEYYKSAVASIKKADRADLKGAAKEQIDLLQDTVNTVIGHARESLAVVAEARSEIAKLVQKGMRGDKVKEAQLKKAVAPARKAVKDVGAAAKSAGKQASKRVRKAAAGANKPAAKTEKSVITAARQAASKAVTDVRSGAKSAAASLNLAVSKVTPSPGSRAGRATSKAKEAATSAIESVTGAASNLSHNVSAAVSGAVSAVSDAIKSSE